MKDRAPSAKQLRYLRGLAEQRGESFAYPQTAAEASAEIERLKSRRTGSRSIASSSASRSAGRWPSAATPRL